MFMIDIHSHILPGVDDGAQTERDSITMANEAVKQGIHTIIATPHHKNGSFDNIRDIIITQVNVLNDLFKQEDIPLTVLAGQETRINGNMVEDLNQNELLPLNDTKYLFVEFPHSSVPRYAKQMLFDIQVAGCIPIIVHPERNQELMDRPMKLYEFVQNGALTQVTAASVTGRFGKTIQKFTHQIIAANLTHFIASDAHNTTSRGFHMAEAYKVIREMHGAEAEYLFLENSQLLVDNMNVNRVEPSMIKKRRKFLGIF